MEILDEEGNIVEGIPAKRASNVSAYVTIMYGCNNFCTYCIVPHVRGRERSRLPGDITDEIGELAANGCKEITLLGQNVNSYGKDLGDGYLFPDLLRDVNKIEGIERIRFVTSHPKDLSDDLIDAMAECEKGVRAYTSPAAGRKQCYTAKNEPPVYQGGLPETG